MAQQILVARKMVSIVVPLLMVIALLIVGTGSQKAEGASASGDFPFCYSDELLAESLRANPELQKTMDAQEQAIRNYAETLSSKRQELQTATSNYIIPVVVYVVHSGVPLGQMENITDQQVNSQIAALNTAYSGHGIEFCLATKQGTASFPGPTPGIIRIIDALRTNHHTSDESSLKGLSSLPGDKYLRIWVVKDIDNNSGVVGYARFPGTVPAALEGIVMRYDVFGDAANCGCSNLIPNFDQGKILAHEVGHYLNLYHTFQGGCSGVLPGDCATSGDRVCDTPQIATANTGCPGGGLSCDGTAALIHNEMDYTNDVCRDAFTPGQDTRMLATLNTVRQLLVSPQNLVFTGVQCVSLNASFGADNYNPCTNQIVTFNALNVPGATYAWDFGDGVIGSGIPATHTYASAGTYNVTLTVTSPAGSASSTQQLFVTACVPINSSQGNWFFGFFGELHFDTGLPLPGNAALTHHTISTSEACITQSDSSGNLLFYSDGQRVWNNSHTLVNGGNLLNGGANPTQALSVPDPADPAPANPSSFYLISMRGYTSLPSTNGNFGFTKVSVSGSSVALSAVNTPIGPPAGADGTINEMVTAVPGCGTNYWIIVHGSYVDANPTFRYALFVYPLTASGIGAPAVYPIVGPALFGQLKASPDGTRLAYGTGDTRSQDGSTPGYAHVLDFNRNTGVPSNPRVVNRYAYGVSFSPNSQLLYLTDSVSGIEKIFQYDLSAPNLNSGETLVTEVPEAYSSLQLGPDNKIYVALNGNNNHLAVINFPDRRSTGPAPNACGYSYNGPFLNIPSSGTSVGSGFGLPNMIDARKASFIPTDFSFTASSCSTVSFMAPVCASSYAWNFGDSATSNVQNPTHTYAVDGAYTVTLTLNGLITVTHAITIGLPASSATIFGPAQVCLASGPPFYNYSANGQPGLTYNWTVTGGAISGFSNNDNVDVVWTTLPGMVQLTVTDPVTGCTAARTLTVTQNCTPCPTPIVLTPATLAHGMVGSSYVQNLAASGGCAPHTFTVSGGALPPGLNLSSAGVISGTPTQGGTFTVTIKVIDSCCMLERSYVLIICPVSKPRTYRAGNMDNLMLPTDPATPSAALKAAFPGAIWKNFDDVTIDQWVGHTFTGLPANIVAARLEVRMKPGQSSLAFNDSINLAFSPNPPTVAWGIRMTDIQSNLLHTWNPGQAPQTFTFDLASLPLSPSGTVNLLNDLAALRFIDVAIQDDTTVDYIKLYVWTCPPPRHFFGLPHEALGQAQLASDAKGRLVISNIGSSGQDGVAIDIGESSGFIGNFEQIDLTQGASLATTLRGSVDGASRQTINSTRVEVLGKETRVAVDFSGVRSTMTSVSLFDSENRLITTQTIPNGLALSLRGVVRACMWNDFGFEHQGNITWHWGFTSYNIVGVSLAGSIYSDVMSIDFAPLDQNAFTGAASQETLTIAGLPSIALTSEGIRSMPGTHSCFATGSATLESFLSGLTVTNLGFSGEDGVMIDLGKAESCDFTLDPLDLQGTASVGSYIQAAATGSRNGKLNRSLGQLRVLKTDSAYLVTADFSAIGSTSQRIQVFNGSTLVVDVPGHSGAAGTASAWPRKIGKLAGQLECFTSDYELGTTFRINGTDYQGTQLRVLAEGVSGVIDFKSAFTIRAKGLDEFTLTGEQVTPILLCPPVAITCPASIVVDNSNHPGQCSAVVNYTVPAANCSSVTVVCTPSPGSVFPKGTTTVTCSATGSSGSAVCSFTVTVIPPRLTGLSPAKVWIGLANGNDAGTKFDLLAEVLKNGLVVGAGQVNDVDGGGVGFNNAVLRTISLALSGPGDICPGDALGLRLSVRIAAASGHSSGTARLWYNDAAANSRFDATIGGAINDYFLRDGFVLNAAAGPGPMRTIDVSVSRAGRVNPFKPFGTWSITF